MQTPYNRMMQALRVFNNVYSVSYSLDTGPRNKYRLLTTKPEYRSLCAYMSADKVADFIEAYTLGFQDGRESIIGNVEPAKNDSEVI